MLALGEAILASAPPMQSADPTIVEARVSAGTDDAEERNNGTINLTSSDLEFVDDGASESLSAKS